MGPAQRGVDEDKGSPSRDGANLALTPAPLLLGEGCPQDRVREEKIDRSAEALRVHHHPFLFPSESKLCDNTAQAIVRTKKQRMAVICRCEAVYFRRSNLQFNGRLLRRLGLDMSRRTRGYSTSVSSQ